MTKGTLPQQPDSAGPRLQHRDYDLLRGLFEARMMTLSHAAALYFDGRYEAAAKRVQALKASGYVGDRRRRVGEPSLLYLTKKAFDELTAGGRLAGYPRLTAERFATRARIEQSTLTHELAVMDVRVAITTALAVSSRYRVEEFTTWPRLSNFETMHPILRQRVTVRPDGFLRIVEAGGNAAASNFFLELDRSNEVQRVLAEKVLCYRSYYGSGEFAQRRGGVPDEFRDHAFRVLIVLENAERRNNLAERLMRCTPPIKVQAWLSTRDEVVRDPLGKVWVCPLDYARATAQTPYSPEQWPREGPYVRRPDRERLVEERIIKRSLFDDVA